MKLGPVYIYGLLHALGYGVALVGMRREAKRDGIDPRAVALMSAIVYAAAMLGAWASEQAGMGRTTAVGMAGSFVAYLLALRWLKLEFWTTADVLIPWFVFALALGKVGCFADGCCASSILPGVQLWEASGLAVLGTGLIVLKRRWRVFPGQAGLSFFIAYPLIRGFARHFRDEKSEFGDLISLVFCAGTLGVLIFRLIQQKKGSR